MYFCSSVLRTLHFIQIADYDIKNIYKKNHVPQPQEEKLGYYFQSETCPVALETHVF